MKRNVYDFDKTIYAGDSTLDFYRFCVKRHPYALLSLPAASTAGLAYKLRVCTKAQFKEMFYHFLRHIPDVDGELEKFWNKSFEKIKPWYISQKDPNDLVISSSPEFLLKIPCEKLGIDLIASQVDKHTGKTTSENCKEEEKVLRFRKQCPVDTIGEFYSDSLSDTPLAKLAERAFLVDGNTIKNWI